VQVLIAIEMPHKVMSSVQSFVGLLFIFLIPAAVLAVNTVNIVDILILIPPICVICIVLFFCTFRWASPFFLLCVSAHPVLVCDN